MTVVLLHADFPFITLEAPRTKPPHNREMMSSQVFRLQFIEFLIEYVNGNPPLPRSLPACQGVLDFFQNQLPVFPGRVTEHPRQQAGNRMWEGSCLAKNIVCLKR